MDAMYQNHKKRNATLIIEVELVENFSYIVEYIRKSRQLHPTDGLFRNCKEITYIYAPFSECCTLAQIYIKKPPNHFHHLAKLVWRLDKLILLRSVPSYRRYNL